MRIVVVQRFDEITCCERYHPFPPEAKEREAEVYKLARTIQDQFYNITLDNKHSPYEDLFFELLNQLSDAQDFLLSKFGRTIQEFKDILISMQNDGREEPEIENIKAEYNRKLSDMFSLLSIWLKKYDAAQNSPLEGR